MAMSDCPNCWETPCACGHEYRRYNDKSKIELISAVLGVSTSEYVVDNGTLDRLKEALINKRKV